MHDQAGGPTTQSWGGTEVPHDADRAAEASGFVNRDSWFVRRRALHRTGPLS